MNQEWKTMTRTRQYLPLLLAFTVACLLVAPASTGQAVSSVTAGLSTPDQVLIISDSDSSSNLVVKLSNEGPGSADNYTFIKIEETSTFYQVIFQQELEQYHSMFFILSDFEDDLFNSTVIAKLDDRISNGVSIGIISSRIWKARDGFRQFLGVNTPATDPEYSCGDGEVVTFTVQNDTYLTAPHAFTAGQDINISTDIGIISGTDGNTETVLLSEPIGELPGDQRSGIYLRSRGDDKGKILTIPLLIEDMEDDTILDLITSISYYTITWSNQVVLNHLPSLTNNQSNPGSTTPSAGLPFSLAPRDLVAVTAVTGGVIAVGAGGIAAVKGMSRARSRSKDEEEWSPERGWLVFILGPIIGIIAQIIYSPNIRKISLAQVQDHPARRQIIDTLEYREFEHFNALRKQLRISVSSLTWHLQVLEDFSIIRTSAFGQYKVLYLAGNKPEKEQVILGCTVRSKKALEIVKRFTEVPTWSVSNLSQLLYLNRALVKYHCFKLVSIAILMFSEETDSFYLVQEKKDLLVWLLGRETTQ
ncbi:MAG: hypothetical protein ACFFD4_17970 [Candidatus Odinarchaeota archaeon]